ncbi:MAG: AraC family transcriptional regulator [Myxococcota bacterium]|nr:AraC family transcriptional regulator [Myxococcota bacterium]
MQLPEAAPLSLWPSRLAVQTPGDASAGHAHHTMHLVLAREGTLTLRGDTLRGDTVRAETVPADRVAGAHAGVLTPPDVPHALDAEGQIVVLLFIDPESRPGRRLRAGLEGIRTLSAGERDALLEGLPARPTSSELDAWARRTLDRLAGEEAPAPMHPKVRALLEALRELPPDADTSLEALAARVSLSPSRLMHAFTESVGIPLRPYLRWLRVQRAATAIVTGTPLSLAAAEAGFSDAAHMSRTFKQMFGMTPSALQRRAEIDSQSVQAR